MDDHIIATTSPKIAYTASFLQTSQNFAVIYWCCHLKLLRCGIRHLYRCAVIH